MNIERFREYCLSLKGAWEDLPFDQNTLVFKVCGRMFALTDIESFEIVNLKCDPEKAVELREQFEAVIPGYHMNKKHWNTVIMDGSIPDRLLQEWIVDSYQLVYAGLTRKEKDELRRGTLRAPDE